MKFDLFKGCLIGKLSFSVLYILVVCKCKVSEFKYFNKFPYWLIKFSYFKIKLLIVVLICLE